MSDRPTRDTDPCPTSVDHDAPEPTLRQVLDRVEETRGLTAHVLGRLGAIDTLLSRLIADAALTRGEERRHGSDLAALRAELPCLDGGNHGVPSGCPEAAE